MILLFEDNPATPSSRLLSRSLYGKNIRFSNGNQNLMKVADDLVKQGNSVIIFVDMSVNSLATKTVYTKLARKYRSSEHVFVLPIVCIEYYILQMLCKHGFLGTEHIKTNTVVALLDNFVKEINGTPLQYSDKGNILTLEKQYKYILNTIGKQQKCMINTYSKGNFYTCGCPCSPYCKEYKLATIDYKAEALYTSLPVFYLDSKYAEHINNIGMKIHIKDYSIKDAFVELVQLHKKLNVLYGTEKLPTFTLNKKFIEALA